MSFEEWLEDNYMEGYAALTAKNAWNHQQKEIDALKLRLAKTNKVLVKLGPWASAALDDPKVCQELRKIFSEVVDMSVLIETKKESEG